MNKQLRWALQLLSLALFLFIIWWAGEESWQTIRHANWRLLWPALLLHMSAGFLSALRLRLVAHTMSQKKLASIPRFYQLNMTARALGIILPRSISTIGGKSAGLHAMGVPLKQAVWLVLTDNLLDVLWLGSWAIAALLFFTDQISSWQLALVIFSTTILLTAVLRYLPQASWLQKLWHTFHQHRSLTRITKKLPPEINQLLLPSHTVPVTLLLTTILNLALATNFYFIARSLDLKLSLAVFFAGFALTQLSLIVSFLPGGLGVFDGSWLGLLTLYGFPIEEAAVFVLAQRIYIWLFVLISYIFSIAIASIVEKYIHPFD